MTINYKDKYNLQLQSIKDNYKAFDLPYNGKDNDDYVNGQGFCCNDGSLEAAHARLMAKTRVKADDNFHDKDAYEKMQFYYHPDHLGSSSYITNLDGEVAQHIEYVPFGEVFIEERNITWNTPYLFNAKEFDEETGMYYYGARYYEPRLSLWMSVDPLTEKYAGLSGYVYTIDNPVKLIDVDGRDIYELDIEGNINLKEKTKENMDRIIASNNLNNYIDVNKGVLESHETQNIRTRSITYGNGTAVLDLYNYKEDFHDVYQFLVDNSEVEWAYMSLKDQSGSDLFYMGTSHSHNTNATPSFVYDRSLDRNYTILSFEHNHDLGNDVVSYGDVEIAKTIQGKFPKASLKIGFPFTTEKVFYDRNTIPATLKGVEVVAPLPEKFKNKQHK